MTSMNMNIGFHLTRGPWKDEEPHDIAARVRVCRTDGLGAYIEVVLKLGTADVALYVNKSEEVAALATALETVTAGLRAFEETMTVKAAP